MLNIAKDIDSLSNFKRKTSDFMKRMKTGGQPVVLTINGKAKMVVQDVESYQRMLNEIERLKTIEAIRQEMEDVRAGRTIKADKVHKHLRKKYKIAD